MTRVSNDTEAVNELFSQILAKLFKNSVKIIGFAVMNTNSVPSETVPASTDALPCPITMTIAKTESM